MNQNIKNIFWLPVVCYSIIITSDSDNHTCHAQSQNLWQPHAFAISAGREILLKKDVYALTDNDESWFGEFSVGFEFMRSFNLNSKDSKRCSNLGSLPFWAADLSNTMTVGDNSGLYDLDAYQLGLGPVTTNGTVTLNPLVYQTGADFSLIAGVNKTDRGFFLELHAPVGIISVKPRLCSSDTLVAEPYPAGAFDVSSTTTAPFTTISQAFGGEQSAGFYKPMTKAIINGRRTSSAKFGDVEASIGYNFIADEQKHCGLALRFSAPTGNKAEGCYVLEPIFGRNGHWGLGAEIIGHWKFWDSDSNNTKASLWFDGNIVHLFRSKQIRSFDFINNGLGSKYLLLANYNGNVFQNEIINAVNITTTYAESTFAVEGDFALVLDFQWSNWNFDIGYEGWGRTCEHLNDCYASYPTSVNFNNYAIIGRQQYANPAATIVHLCEPGATIGKSQDAATAATATILDATIAANRLPETGSLNIEAQRAPSVYTSKAFIQVCYTCKDSSYTPFVGISTGAEFPNLGKNAAAYFWNVGLQAGLSF